MELHLQATDDVHGNLPMEVATSSVLPAVLPLQALPDPLAGSSLSIHPKSPESTVCVVPMLVDESDHEEVPTIDLDTDSDT